MNQLLAHGGMFAASNSLLVFLPFVLIGFGLGFVIKAFNDKIDRKPNSKDLTRLPDSAARPLYHVHMQIRSGSKPSSASRAAGPAVAKLPARMRH
jgi:hypothetical protein